MILANMEKTQDRKRQLPDAEKPEQTGKKDQNVHTPSDLEHEECHDGEKHRVDITKLPGRRLHVHMNGIHGKNSRVKYQEIDQGKLEAQ